jgi:hypothetical protein
MRSDRVRGLAPEVLTALLAKAASVQNLLVAEAVAQMVKARKRKEREQSVEGPDRTLDADQAARRIGTTRRWLFRMQPFCPSCGASRKSNSLAPSEG